MSERQSQGSGEKVEKMHVNFAILVHFNSCCLELLTLLIGLRSF